MKLLKYLLVPFIALPASAQTFFGEELNVPMSPKPYIEEHGSRVHLMSHGTELFVEHGLAGEDFRGAAGVTATSIDPPPIPYSIRLFERTQISAVVVGWINAALTYRLLLHERIGPLAYAGAMMALSGLVAVLMFRIARRRSSVCKWILVMLSAAMIAPWLALLKRIGISELQGVLLLLQGGLQLLALYLLVRPDARAWFASRPTE